LQDGAAPIDNDQIENLIRPWALGRSNWLFAGSLRSEPAIAAASVDACLIWARGVRWPLVRGRLSA